MRRDVRTELKLPPETSDFMVAICEALCMGTHEGVKVPRGTVVLKGRGAESVWATWGKEGWEFTLMQRSLPDGTWP